MNKQWQVLIQTRADGPFIAARYWSDPFRDIRPARRWRIKAAKIFHGAKLVEVFKPETGVGQPHLTEATH